MSARRLLLSLVPLALAGRLGAQNPPLVVRIHQGQSAQENASGG